MNVPEHPSYRAYVGHPEAFDVLGASQFLLLFSLGLREFHSVLDVGCGSLRSGRLLIPFLERGQYNAIEPNRWLVDSAIRLELGDVLLSIKEPHFRFSSDLNLSAFGCSFDYVQAHSVVTHMPHTMISVLFSQVSLVLGDHGIFVGTYLDGQADFTGSDWIYPELVSYRWETIRQTAERFCLRACRLVWPHPRQIYFLLTKKREVLDAIVASRLTPYSPSPPRLLDKLIIKEES